MERKLKKNLSYQTLYQLLTVVTPLIVTPYVSRILGSNNIGIYSYTYSIAYYFVMFSFLGVANYGNRTMSINNTSCENRSKTFWEIYSFQLFMTIIMTLIYLLYVIFCCDSEKIISLIQIIYVSTSALDVSWLFFGLEDVKPVVIRNTIVKLMSLFGIFLFVKCSDDLWIYTILLNGGQFIGCATMWASLNKYIYFVKPSLKGIKKHIVPNIKLFIPVIAISVYKTMDKIMLGSISTNSQVGFYTNAESLINAPMGFIVAVGTVMLPRITNLLKNDEIEKSKIYFKKSLKLTMCFSCAVAFGLIAVAPTFVPLYYGNGFEDCIFLIQGQAIVMLFLAWANVIRTQFLLPHQHDKQYIYSIIIGACVNVILNLVLIPNYAAAGALIATIFAEGTVCVIQSFDAAKYINMINCLYENSYFILSGIVMLIFIRLLDSYIHVSNIVLYLLFQILCGVSIYILMLIIYYLFNTKILKKQIYLK